MKLAQRLILLGQPAAVGGGLEFVGSSSAVSATSTTFNLTLPEGIEEGDFVLVLVGCGYDSDRDRVLSPSGYTTLVRPSYAAAVWPLNGYIGYKFMGETPDTTLSIAASASYPADFGTVAVAHVWRGVNTTTPFDVESVVTYGTSPDSRLVTAGGITPVSNNVAILAACMISDGDSFTMTQPSGYENTVQAQRDPSGGMTVCLSSYSPVSTPSGSVNWDNFSIPSRTTNWNCFAGIMMALRPA